MKTEHSENNKSWLEKLSQALLREPQDREQLVHLLRDAEHRNLLDQDALSMIEGVLQVSQMQVRDIMIPRAQMVVVEIDMSLSDCLPIIIESRHSRFPVIGENRDEVIGIIHAKDLLKFMVGKDSKFNIRDILRPPVFVPESKHLNILLKDFRRTRNHMAIVVDEYGGVGGFVTIEDVLEQIVGEIEDEFDIDEETAIKKLSPTEYTVKALTPVEEFNEFFNTDLDPQSYDTIGGLIAKACGHMPNQGEIIKIDGFDFEVLRADSRRVHLLKLIIKSR